MQMRRSLTAVAVLMLLALTEVPLEARQGAGGALASFPQDNLPERRPTPGLTPDSDRPGSSKGTGSDKPDSGPGIWETIGDALGAAVDAVKDLQAKLSEYMPAYAAWAVVTAPLWLVVLVAIFRSAWHAMGRKRQRKRDSDKVAAAESPSQNGRSGARGPEPTARRAPDRRPRVEPIPPLSHSPAEALMLMTEDSRESLHEMFVAMGVDAHSLRALRQVAGEVLDEAAWLGAVQGQDLSLVEPLRERWVRTLAAFRVQAWLESHPQVRKSRLVVGMPQLHEVTELGSVALTRSDGMAADLSVPLEQLLQQARGALERAWREPGPYTLMLAARESKMPALLGNPEIDHFALALTLHGAAAATHGAAARGDSPAPGEEFEQALQEHLQLVDTPVGGEGCATHALNAIGSGRLDGIGTICASMAGAAFSPSAVNLRICQSVNVLNGAQEHACEQLGVLASEALARPKTADGAAFLKNLRRVLGRDLLEAAGGQSDETLAQLKRMSKNPVWADSTGETPDQVLLGLHRTLLSHATRQTEAAELRLLGLFDQVARGGAQEDGERQGHQRLGYAVACFNMALLRSTNTELLSAGREALRELTR